MRLITFVVGLSLLGLLLPTPLRAAEDPSQLLAEARGVTAAGAGFAIGDAVAGGIALSGFLQPMYLSEGSTSAIFVGGSAELVGRTVGGPMLMSGAGKSRRAVRLLGGTPDSPCPIVAATLLYSFGFAVRYAAGVGAVTDRRVGTGLSVAASAMQGLSSALYLTDARRHQGRAQALLRVGGTF